MCEESIKKAHAEIDAKAEEIKKELSIEITNQFRGDFFNAVNLMLKGTEHDELNEFSYWQLGERQFLISSSEKKAPLYYMVFDEEWNCIHFSTPSYKTIGKF